MSDSLVYLTLDQQIEKLKSQKLEFLNENFAREVLQIYGYFNIINGYREPYILHQSSYKHQKLSCLRILLMFTNQAI